MANLSTPGPIRTAKTPKRVRFASEHERAQQRIARREAFEQRDARALPRVDAEISTHYDFSSLTAFGGAIADYAKSSLDSVVQLGKTALGKVIPSLAPSKKTTPKKQSMLEYPPFIAGATPNVVKKNRRDYYQSAEVLNSIRKAKAYDPSLESFRTPEHLQSDKEKNWYRFHDTPYEGHKLDFGHRNGDKTRQPVFQFRTPSRRMSTPSKSKSTQKSATRKRSKGRLGTKSRRSNAEEFHANFVKDERNELYASYTRFLNTLRFDVKAFAKDLQDYQLPTKLILKLHDQAKRADWDYFLRAMADEEYWAQVKGVGNTKVPDIENYKKPEVKPNSRVNPCDYCKGQPWAGKIELREVEREGDLVERRGHSKFEIPYTPEEQSHIDGGRYYKVFHRFCHESRYDWKFPDPSKSCSWDGPEAQTASLGPDWSITKYDPRLRHFPLLMHKMPKRMRQHQIDLADMVKTLSEQDRAAWLYIQGIRRYNIRMADKLEKLDVERKRNQVLWPCQLQVEVKIRNKRSEPEAMEVEVTKQVESGAKRRLDLLDEKEKSEMADNPKRVRLHDMNIAEGTNRNFKRVLIEEGTDEGKEKDEPRKKIRFGETVDGNQINGAATVQEINDHKTQAGKFGLFFDNDESMDDNTIDEDALKAIETTKGQLNIIPDPAEQAKAASRMSFTEQIYHNVREREKELAEAEITEMSKVEQEPAKPKHAEASKIDFIFKQQHFAPPPQQASAPKAPSSNAFIFEDKTQEEPPINAIDEGINALKEHTNGVKPSSTPSLFSNAENIPALAPVGLSLDLTEAYPSKPPSAPLKAPKKNDENIPQEKSKEASIVTPSFTFSAQTTSTAAPTSTGLFAPVPSAPIAPNSTSLFLFGAPKAEEPKKEASTSLFKFSVPAKAEETKTSNSTSSVSSFLFSAPKIEQQDAVPLIFSGLAGGVTTETRSIFQFGSKAPPAESSEERNAITVPTTTAPTIFTAGAATDVSKPLFQFRKPETETAGPPTSSSAPSLLGVSTTRSTTYVPQTSLVPAATISATTLTAIQSVFSKPTEPTSLFGAPTISASNSDSASTTTAPSILSNAVADASKLGPFMFGAGISSSKPAGSVTEVVTSAPPVAGATTSGPMYQFGAFSKSEEGTVKSNIPQTFNFGAIPPAAISSSFTFGATNTEPSKVSSVPAAPKSPRLRNSLNEDVSMASPDQSPEKPSPRPIFGLGNTVTGFNPAPESFSFGASQLPEPSPLKFGPSISAPSLQPAVSTSAPTVPGTPAKLDFTGFTSGTTTPAGTPGPGTPTQAPAGASGFKFDTSGVDFSLTANPSSRKFATPRPPRRHVKK